MLHKALLSSPKEFRVSIASRNRPADRKICVFFFYLVGARPLDSA